MPTLRAVLSQYPLAPWDSRAGRRGARDDERFGSIPRRAGGRDDGVRPRMAAGGHHPRVRGAHPRGVPDGGVRGRPRGASERERRGGSGPRRVRRARASPRGDVRSQSGPPRPRAPSAWVFRLRGRLTRRVVVRRRTRRRRPSSHPRVVPRRRRAHGGGSARPTRRAPRPRNLAHPAHRRLVRPRPALRGGRGGAPDLQPPGIPRARAKTHPMFRRARPGRPRRARTRHDGDREPRTRHRTSTHLRRRGTTRPGPPPRARRRTRRASLPVDCRIRRVGRSGGIFRRALRFVVVPRAMRLRSLPASDADGSLDVSGRARIGRCRRVRRRRVRRRRESCRVRGARDVPHGARTSPRRGPVEGRRRGWSTGRAPRDGARDRRRARGGCGRRGRGRGRGGDGGGEGGPSAAASPRRITRAPSRRGEDGHRRRVPRARSRRARG